MPDKAPDRLRHLLIEGRVDGQSFTTPPQGGRSGFSTPPRDRFSHADKLRSELDGIREQARCAEQERLAAGVSTDFGLVIEFASDPGFELKAESLERRRSGIQLLNLRSSPVRLPDGSPAEIQFATVGIPYGPRRLRLISTLPS